MCMYVISGTSLTNEHYSLFNQRQCLTSECLCLAINAIVCELHMIVNSNKGGFYQWYELILTVVKVQVADQLSDCFTSSTVFSN